MREVRRLMNSDGSWLMLFAGRLHLVAVWQRQKDLFLRLEMARRTTPARETTRIRVCACDLQPVATTPQ